MIDSMPSLYDCEDEEGIFAKKKLLDANFNIDDGRFDDFTGINLEFEEPVKKIDKISFIEPVIIGKRNANGRK